MFNTINMGLVAWDLGTDPYDHAQLATNFTAIDRHDHSLGKGVQISTAGLADRSVTELKIALQAVGAPELQDNSVGGSKIIDGSITTAELADNSVTTSKIVDKNVTTAKLADDIIPIGTVISWYRPNSGVALPGSGWEICDGRPWSSITNAWGVSTGNIPDLRNRFILGAATSGTGTGTGTPPDIGAPGAGHTVDLSHTHDLPSHTHTVPDHQHTITTGGSHTHQFLDDSGNPHDARSRTVGLPTTDGFRQALFVPGLQATDTGAGSSVAGPLSQHSGHNHTGVTGGAPGLTTGPTSAGTTGGASPSISSVDKRPAYVGLLYIMRVR